MLIQRPGRLGGDDAENFETAGRRARGARRRSLGGLGCRARAAPLVLLTGDNIPPLAQGTLAGVQALLQKAIGPMGQGFRWFVFEGGAVHACEPGGLSLAYDGETYTYQTPIPGCPAK